jgi:hypothetical protein
MKKLVQPIKFKRAIRTLEEYIDASNGVDDSDEWNEEVAQARATINPKDAKRFDETVEQLKMMGEMISEAYQYLNDRLFDLNQLVNKIK